MSTNYVNCRYPHPEWFADEELAPKEVLVNYKEWGGASYLTESGSTEHDEWGGPEVVITMSNGLVVKFYPEERDGTTVSMETFGPDQEWSDLIDDDSHYTDDHDGFYDDLMEFAMEMVPLHMFMDSEGRRLGIDPENPGKFRFIATLTEQEILDTDWEFPNVPYPVSVEIEHAPFSELTIPGTGMFSFQQFIREPGFTRVTVTMDNNASYSVLLLDVYGYTQNSTMEGNWAEIMVESHTPFHDSLEDNLADYIFGILRTYGLIQKPENEDEDAFELFPAAEIED